MKIFVSAAALAIVMLSGLGMSQSAEARVCGYWGWRHHHRVFIGGPCHGPRYGWHHRGYERRWHRGDY